MRKNKILRLIKMWQIIILERATIGQFIKLYGQILCVSKANS